jgi:hypothetical protein
VRGGKNRAETEGERYPILRYLPEKVRINPDISSIAGLSVGIHPAVDSASVNASSAMN